ncbi:MAG: iron-containing alcohol dehydrogenase [Fusobacterium sp.]|nr:iron-containing alcohol dehydrogenase [Fusobacterium sp.]
MIKNFVYQNPTKIIFGKNQIKTLAKEISKFGKKVLLVYGGGSIKRNGIYQQIQNELKDFEIFELPGVEPNPRVSTARKGIEIIRKNNIDFILAVGGGSTIDCTKLISAGVFVENDAWDIVLGKSIPKKALPYGVILTISATGSEMNNGSVITNLETGEKLSWRSPLVYPKFSILDPSYTFSLPSNQTVNGIIDSMSHLLEQYFNKEYNPLMDSFIEGAMKTIMAQAPIVLEEPENYEARAVLMMSATVALNHSLAWGVVGDWATHKIEHAISAIYDIPHGEGLAIIMPNWIDFLRRKDLKRVKEFAVNIMNVEISNKTDEEIAKEGAKKLQDFWKKIGSPTRLSDKNIPKENLIKIADLAANEIVGFAHQLTKDEIYEILKLAY